MVSRSASQLSIALSSSVKDGSLLARNWRAPVRRCVHPYGMAQQKKKKKEKQQPPKQRLDPRTRHTMALARDGKVAAAELELDPHALEAASAFHAPLRLAIGVAGLHALDYEAEVVGVHAEEEDDALLVDRRVLKGAEVDELAVGVALLRRPRGRGGRKVSCRDVRAVTVRFLLCSVLTARLAGFPPGAGRTRLPHAESDWPAQATVLAAIALQLLLPKRLTAGPRA